LWLDTLIGSARKIKERNPAPSKIKDLDALRKKIGERPAYVMFNNNTMKEDALRFLEIIKTSVCQFLCRSCIL